MNDKKERTGEHVSVTIPEGFYWDRTLDMPTVIKEYDRVEAILNELGYMACITVQVEALSRIEYQYGSTSYNFLLGRITEILKELKDREFRGKDVFVVDLYDADTLPTKRSLSTPCP